MNNNIPKKKWIAYVGPFGFPNGGAAARRIMGNSQSLVEAGYDVTIVSGQNDVPIDTDELPIGVRVISIGERNAEHLPVSLKRFIYVGMGRKTKRWLESLENKPDVIIVYSGYSPYLLRLLPFCRKFNIPIIFDAVEWYQQDGFIKNLISPYQLNIDLAMRYLLPKLDGIIAISKYLENFYQNKNCKTIRVPPTADLNSINPRLDGEINSPIRLAYTGTPSKKDCLNEIIEGVILSRESGIAVELHVAGPTSFELLSYPVFKEKNITSLPSCIICHNRLSHKAAINLVKSCDFSVLLRNINRVSTAGFSTKLVESLCVGTPPIVNITGDIGDYVSHGENGFICKNPSAKSVINAIELSSSLSESEYKKMRVNARLTAEKYFDFHSYVDAFKVFIKSVKGSQ